jgi:hypothetical protein
MTISTLEITGYYDANLDKSNIPSYDGVPNYPSPTYGPDMFVSYVEVTDKERALEYLNGYEYIVSVDVLDERAW